MRRPHLLPCSRFITSPRRASPAPELIELISQYPILYSLAGELTVLDILNLSLACKSLWFYIASPKDPLRISEHLVRAALQCYGLYIQIRPVVRPDLRAVCLLPCMSGRLSDVRRCQGCGVGICETCRFRITHGTMLTLTGGRHWFFPSRTASRPDLIAANLKYLLSSFQGRGRPSSARAVKQRCARKMEARWLDSWLCVPCLNVELAPPADGVEKQLVTA